MDVGIAGSVIGGGKLIAVFSNQRTGTAPVSGVAAASHDVAKTADGHMIEHAAGAGLDAIDLKRSELGRTHLKRVPAAYNVVSREDV
jgi:hypothetical protein